MRITVLNGLSKMARFRDAAEAGYTKTRPLSSGKSLDKSLIAEIWRYHDEPVQLCRKMKDLGKESDEIEINDMEAWTYSVISIATFMNRSIFSTFVAFLQRIEVFQGRIKMKKLRKTK